jgi:predicted acyl esterase
MKLGKWILYWLVGVGVLAHGSRAAAEEKFDTRQHYTKSEHMVPMRDGVRLFTIVYAPKDTETEYPILLFRTPYSIAPYGPDKYRKSVGPSVPPRISTGR